MNYRIELTENEYVNIDSDKYSWVVHQNGALAVYLVEDGQALEPPAFLFSPSCWRFVSGGKTGGLLIHERGVN